MNEYILIAFCTFLASLMTFYSGFGLGTLLMPVIALFVPLPLAIGLTGAIHLTHNFLKASLLWKAVDMKVALRFGGSALFSAAIGALVLSWLSRFPSIASYDFFGIKAEISYLGVSIGLLLLFFATLEMFPRREPRFKNLYLGGALSGFFGGLSGHQGAFRGLFLINTHLDKEAYIATNAVIATVVDIGRLIIYSITFETLITLKDLPILSIALSSALVGIFIGMILLRKITITFIRRLVMVLLYSFGLLFIMGLI